MVLLVCFAWIRLALAQPLDTLHSGAPAITLPPHQWTALPVATVGRTSLPGRLKHVSWGYNPDDRRLYFTAGDYPAGSGNESYRQETWSLSLRERWADKANVDAGWRLTYLYCGPAGGVQPKHPDFGGLRWDPIRQLFWWAVGVQEATALEICPGETPGKQSDPGFLMARLMTFDPAVPRWADAGPLSAAFTHIWDTVYDATSDSLIQIFEGVGAGTVGVATYRIPTQTWSYTTAANSALHGLRATLYGGKGMLAWDAERREIYWGEAWVPGGGRLLRYSVATRKLEDLGPLPPATAVAKSANQLKMVWDAKHRVVYWHNHQPNEFFAYHPETTRWERLETTSDVPGVEACVANILAYDPDEDVLVAWGDVWGDPGTCQATARPYMFWYRYQQR